MRKVGDITEDGWEITKVEMKPIYTQRRRVRVVSDFLEDPEYNYNMEKLSGKLGWQYTNDAYVWIELDVYPGKTYRFRSGEIQILNQNKDDENRRYKKT